MEQFAAAVCLTYEKNNSFSFWRFSMDKQTAEPKPKKQEETLSFCGVAISVKSAGQQSAYYRNAETFGFLLWIL